MFDPPSEFEITKRLESRNISISMQMSYMGANKKYDFRCLKTDCNHTWKTTWASVVTRGSGCPKCSGHFMDEATKQLKIQELINRGIKIITPYSGKSSKHTFKCMKSSCGHEWSTTWYAIHYNKSGCPKCLGQVVDKSRQEEKILDMKSRYIEPIHPYKNTHHKTEFRCLKIHCGHVWNTSWNNATNKKTGCPKCAGQYLDPEEKILASFRSRLRLRLSQMFKNGYLATRCDKDDSFMRSILQHWEVQMAKLPKEPDDGQKWHLDHIIPVCKFDHSDIEQVKLCWDYRNLQWLTESQNCSKSAKLMPEYFTDWHYRVLDKLELGAYIKNKGLGTVSG